MIELSGRSWAFVVYLDSAPENWKEILQQTGLPFCISPYHDHDVNPDNTPKKPHYHVICYYENPTTYKNVKTNVCDKINATIPIKLESMRGMYRYHLHLDNPEKYQYPDWQREFYNGFDVMKVTELTKTEVQKLLKEIIAFINDNDILEYSDLLNSFLANNFNELFDVASSHTVLLNTFICSKRNKIKESSRS